MNYVALLRGINVGGKNMIKMAELKESLARDGIEKVRTYIQSGNILFTSDEKDTLTLGKKIEKHILDEYGHTVPTLVLSEKQLEAVVKDAPKGWGEKSDWRYYLLFVLPPADAKAIIATLADPKPDIETIDAGAHVIYQAAEIKSIGRTLAAKIMSHPDYKSLTIRNWNTTRKLAELIKIK